MLNDFRRYGLIFLVLVLSSLIGCGGGEKDAKKDEPISKRIVGNWQGKFQIDDTVFESFAKENNLPGDIKEDMKKTFEEGTMLLSFQEDGTGKGGMDANGRVHLDDIKWKVENESGNKAQIVIQEVPESDGGKLDVTFQEDGSIIANLIPPEKEKRPMPNFPIHLKKVDELPKEAASRASEKTMPAKTPARATE